MSKSLNRFKPASVIFYDLFSKVDGLKETIIAYIDMYTILTFSKLLNVFRNSVFDSCTLWGFDDIKYLNYKPKE